MMLHADKTLGRAGELNTRIAQVFEKRANLARQHFTERTQKALADHLTGVVNNPMSAWDLFASASDYLTDMVQRSILFWDTLRQRGVRYVEHERAGKPPVLHFEYETVLDARKFKRPVNYSLLRIIPPKGVTIDAKRRPYIIIDPRAGHGPGIGGFKDDSEIGVAIREGHPVYFVSFFPDPEPGQTMLHVTAAEQQFVHKVRELHPQSPKPVLVGNCQGGWAAMMLAASTPEDTGPIVINGAPMSYWGGAWSEGEGDNPMRYAGGLLGGSWPASLAADLGNGVFDGAWLAQNFENPNPANALWDKYYHLYANVDTEPPRFLDFERWWGGYFLLNREEIEWITRNLFVGNRLWSGDVRSNGGRPFDLRDIKSPIILFASLGDNITPPQQAFNWVADIYGSTDEIKARGQVIIGLLHQDIGHLGIFVSGRVAKKEHKQIVSVLKSIEALPPGLYGMQIIEQRGTNGKVEYNVQFVERNLEEVQTQLNRFKRADEQAFEAVEKIAQFNQHAYELFARPLVQAMSNEAGARVLRALHPLRVQNWAVSDLNPWLAWLGPLASTVAKNRRPLGPDAPARKIERAMSEVVSASLDFYREMRDAVSEALFFQVYGNIFSFHLADGALERNGKQSRVLAGESTARQEAITSMAKGGYPEAVARVFSLLARRNTPFPLAQIHLKREIAETFADLLPKTTIEQQRRIRGQQDLIVRHDPERALETLPVLLANQDDHKRLCELLKRVMTQENLRQLNVEPEQIQMLERIQRLLAETPTPPRARRSNLKPKRRAVLQRA